MAYAVKGLFSKFNKNVLKTGKEKKTPVHIGNERQKDCIILFRATVFSENPFIKDDWYAHFVVGVDIVSEKPSKPLVTALDGLRNSDAINSDVKNSDVRNSDVRNSDVRNSDIRNSDVRKSDARSSDVRNSDVRNSNARRTDLQKDLPISSPPTSSVVEQEEEVRRNYKEKHGKHSEEEVTRRHDGKRKHGTNSEELIAQTITPDSGSEESGASEGKEKEQEVKLRNRVSNIFQGVRKSRVSSRVSRDSGVGSSVTDSLNLDWIGDDDFDLGNDDLSDDSDFDDEFYEDFQHQISDMDVDEKQTEDLACKISVFILQTEREYVQQLTQLIKILSGLADVVKKHKGSDPACLLREMSSSAASILQFHNEFFLPGLTTRLTEWRSKPYLGDLMKTNAPFFKLYRAYTLRFEDAVPVMSGWKKDPKKFASLIRDIKKLPEFDIVPFQDFMWCPVKRLRALQFFLTAYLKNIPNDTEETKAITDALELLSDAKEYPQKITRTLSVHKVKNDIKKFKGSRTPPPPITEEEPMEEPQTEVHPEDTIIPKDKVQRIILELLTTERSYVRKLRLLQTIERHLRKDNTMPDDAIEEIFSKLESVLVFHAEHLLPQIEERVVNWETNKRIGDVLKRNAPFLKIYAVYIENYEKAKNKIETWKKKSSKFASMLSEIQNWRESGGIPLEGHLLEPVQRVPRYELLIKEYLKNISEHCVDRRDAEDALKLVKEAACHSNQFLKKMDQFKKTYDVYQTLKGTKFDFSVSHRELLKEGLVTLITPGTCEKQRKIIYLFSDVIVLCSEALFGKFNVSSQIELRGLKISKGENSVVPDTFIVMGTNITVELQNIEDGDTDWYQEITNLLQERESNRMSLDSDTDASLSPSTLDDKTSPNPMEISKEDIGKRAPRLKPFQTAIKCMRCRTKFSSTMKKYNCKGCGFVICNKCSRHVRMEYKNMKLERACYECYMLLHHDSSSDNSDENDANV